MIHSKNALAAGNSGSNPVITPKCDVSFDITRMHARTHTHTFNGPFSGTTQVSRYEKGQTNLDFTEARDSEWQWHQLGHMQVCTLLQTDNHTSTPPLCFLKAGCPSCRPTNSVKALKAFSFAIKQINILCVSDMWTSPPTSPPHILKNG